MLSLFISRSLEVNLSARARAKVVFLPPSLYSIFVPKSPNFIFCKTLKLGKNAEVTTFYAAKVNDDDDDERIERCRAQQ